MVGFEVSPVTCLARTMSASFPERSRSRVMKSSQGDWPSSCSVSSVLAMAIASSVALESGELGDATYVTRLGRVARREERPHEVGGEGRADHAGPEGEHVHVVV